MTQLTHKLLSKKQLLKSVIPALLAATGLAASTGFFCLDKNSSDFQGTKIEDKPGQKMLGMHSGIENTQQDQKVVVDSQKYESGSPKTLASMVKYIENGEADPDAIMILLEAMLRLTGINENTTLKESSNDAALEAKQNLDYIAERTTRLVFKTTTYETQGSPIERAIRRTINYTQPRKSSESTDPELDNFLNKSSGIARILGLPESMNQVINLAIEETLANLEDDQELDKLKEEAEADYSELPNSSFDKARDQFDQNCDKLKEMFTNQSVGRYVVQLLETQLLYQLASDSCLAVPLDAAEILGALETPAEYRLKLKNELQRNSAHADLPSICEEATIQVAESSVKMILFNKCLDKSKSQERDCERDMIQSDCFDSLMKMKQRVDVELKCLECAMDGEQVTEQVIKKFYQDFYTMNKLQFMVDAYLQLAKEPKAHIAKYLQHQ